MIVQAVPDSILDAGAATCMKISAVAWGFPVQVAALTSRTALLLPADDWKESCGLLSSTSRAAALLRAEREGKRAYAGVVRHQCQHVTSSRRTGDQANHSGSIKSRHSV